MRSTSHSVSGLPRAGSTLLASLLRQNPRFHAGMSGPLAGMFGAMLGEMSERNDFAVFINDAQRRRILNGLFDLHYVESTAAAMPSSTISTTLITMRLPSTSVAAPRGWPPDLFQRFANDTFWRDPECIPEGLRID